MSTKGFPKGFPLSVTRTWVGLYTRGLGPQLRAERRAELESDVWEQMRGRPPGTAWLVLLRCLLGIPADVTWRLEQASPGAVMSRTAARMLGGLGAAGHWVTARGIPGLAVLMSWLYLLAGALLLVTLPIGQNPNPPGVAAFGAWCLAGGAMMWKGNGMLDRRPRAGGGLVLGGAVPLGLALYMTVVAPVATGAVVWGTVWRARAASGNSLAKGSYLPIILPRLASGRNWLARGGHVVVTNVLAIGESLLVPGTPAGPKLDMRGYVLRGAAAGLTLGVLGRIWMRTISQHPQFSPGGTGLILVVFSGLGALTGLSLAWRRFGTRRRMLVVRGAAWSPFLLMGPFMLLFLPGLGLAMLRSHREWGPRRRRAVKWSSWVLLSFLVLIMLGAEQGPGLVAAALYLLLAWALYFTNRVALSIVRPARTDPPSLGDGWWARSRPNRSGAGA